MLRTAIEAKMAADIREVLEGLGFIDGISATAAQLADKETVTFWPVILLADAGQRKQNYIVYKFEDDARSIYGDGKPVVARIGCRLDYFTTARFESEAAENVRLLLENAFLGDLWALEFNLYEYDAETNLNHWCYTVYRIYG